MRSVLALLTRAELRVVSGLSINIAAVWLVTLFASNNQLVLLGSLVGLIVAVYLALSSERILELYD